MVPCILRHPYIYTYTEWAEIIGQSHGSRVYWDILYIYTYTEWAEIIGQSTWFPCIFGHPMYLYIYWVGRNDRAAIWVPCILRHPIFHTYTEWAEIIGQSHGSHVYWDILYFYAYTRWAEMIGQYNGSHAYWDILYINTYTERAEIIGQSHTSNIYIETPLINIRTDRYIIWCDMDFIKKLINFGNANYITQIRYRTLATEIECFKSFSSLFCIV